jgi:hypothetical protein
VFPHVLVFGFILVLVFDCVAFGFIEGIVFGFQSELYRKGVCSRWYPVNKSKVKLHLILKVELRV